MSQLRLIGLLLIITVSGCQTTKPTCTTHATVNGDLTECN